MSISTTRLEYERKYFGSQPHPPHDGEAIWFWYDAHRFWQPRIPRFRRGRKCKGYWPAKPGRKTDKGTP